MATSPIAPEAGQFHRSICAYRLAASLRRCGLSEDETDAVEAIVEPMFIEVMKAPAFSAGDVVAKGEAILIEFGEGEVPPVMIGALLDDMRRLAQ